MPWQLEGYALKLSAEAASGYLNVRASSSGGERWRAVTLCPEQKKQINLGTFDKPEEAALALAKHHNSLNEAVASGEPQLQLQLQAADGPGASPTPLRRRGAVEDDEADQGEWQSAPPPAPRAPPPPALAALPCSTPRFRRRP